MLTAKNAPEAAAEPTMAALRARLLGAGNFPSPQRRQRAVAGVPGLRCRVSSMIRGTVGAGVHKIDVFADLGSFLYVRDFARKRGYRICLDGLSHLSLPFMDRATSASDLMKIYLDQRHAPTTACTSAAGQHAASTASSSAGDTDQAIEIWPLDRHHASSRQQVDTMMAARPRRRPSCGRSLRR